MKNQNETVTRVTGFRSLITSHLSLVTLLLGLASAAPAQTNQPAPPTSTQTFFQSAESYLTSFNPAYTWTNVTLEASTGYKQVTGSGATEVVNAQYDIGRFNLGATTEFEGVGSTVGLLNAQAGYALVEYEDTKVDLDLQGGYSWYKSALTVEPELAISKKLTPNTFTRIGISLPIYSKGTFNRSPSFEVSLGFTF